MQYHPTCYGFRPGFTNPSRPGRQSLRLKSIISPRKYEQKRDRYSVRLQRVFTDHRMRPVQPDHDCDVWSPSSGPGPNWNRCNVRLQPTVTSEYTVEFPRTGRWTVLGRLEAMGLFESRWED